MSQFTEQRGFPTTLWTLVLHAGSDESALAREALAQLCKMYWYPLYSFARRRGYAPPDAEDVTQAFFTRLIEKCGLERLETRQGRFRTFLLAAFKNFLANEWDREQAQKRGGGRVFQSIDQGAESRYQREPSHEMTPERHFERQWALTLLEQTLGDLRDEYHAAGNGPLFEELKTVLSGAAGSYADLASRLDRSEGAIKVAVHRLRRRYRDLMRNRIAATVGAGDVDDELRHLLEVLQ